MDNDFDSFIYDLIDKKNLPGITSEVREGVFNELKELLVSNLNRALLNELSDDKLDELNAILDEKQLSKSELESFLTEAGVNIAEVTTKTLLYFQSFYLGLK